MVVKKTFLSLVAFAAYAVFINPTNMIENIH